MTFGPLHKKISEDIWQLYTDEHKAGLVLSFLSSAKFSIMGKVSTVIELFASHKHSLFLPTHFTAMVKSHG